MADSPFAAVDFPASPRCIAIATGAFLWCDSQSLQDDLAFVDATIKQRLPFGRCLYEKDIGRMDQGQQRR